jgi:hypothetical protein
MGMEPGARVSGAVLYDLSKQVAHCYRRAAECREFAAQSVRASDREFYQERERSWLALARSYEFSERLGRMIKEIERQQRRSAPPAPRSSTALKLPICPTCRVEMLFQAPHLVTRMFVQATTILERGYFLCPNCRCLMERLIAAPGD